MHRKLSGDGPELDRDYAFGCGDPVNLVDFLGLKTINFRVGGPAEVDVFNLGGLDHEMEVLRRVMAMCHCEDIQISYEWYWVIYGWEQPDHDSYNTTAARNSADDLLLKRTFATMGNDKIPIWLTYLPIHGSRKEYVGLGYPDGILMRVGYDFYFHPNLLAHELGHAAGYNGGNIDSVIHSSDPWNIM